VESALVEAERIFDCRINQTLIDIYVFIEAAGTKRSYPAPDAPSDSSLGGVWPPPEDPPAGHYRKSRHWVMRDFSKPAEVFGYLDDA